MCIEETDQSSASTLPSPSLTLLYTALPTHKHITNTHTYVSVNLSSKSSLLLSTGSGDNAIKQRTDLCCELSTDRVYLFFTTTL